MFLKDKERPPVFFDSERRRWARVRLSLQAGAAALTVILSGLAISILTTPSLPHLDLGPIWVHSSHHPPRTRPDPVDLALETRFRGVRQSLERQIQTERRDARARAKPSPAAPLERIAFHVNWDDTSWTSLKQNYSHIDKLIAEWIHLVDEEGNIRADDSSKERRTMDFLRLNRPGLPVVPLINNFDSSAGWESQKLAGMLAKPAARARCIDGILSYVRRGQYAGISIDFENLPGSSQPRLVAFMEELYAVFHPLGLEVSQSVPFDDPGTDYEGLEASVDFLILMAYDENASDNEPGPVASQDWYEETLEKRLPKLAPEKTVVALGNYGYDWKKGVLPAAEISFQEALRTAEESEGKITLDGKTRNPHFNYYDDDEVLHRVWYLDAVTLLNQLDAILPYRPRGVALWRMGSEDPTSTAGPPKSSTASPWSRARWAPGEGNWFWMPADFRKTHSPKTLTSL